MCKNWVHIFPSLMLLNLISARGAINSVNYQINTSKKTVRFLKTDISNVIYYFIQDAFYCYIRFSSCFLSQMGNMFHIKKSRFFHYLTRLSFRTLKMHPEYRIVNKIKSFVIKCKYLH